MMIGTLVIGLLAVGVLEFLPGSGWRWLAVATALIVVGVILGLSRRQRHRTGHDAPALGISILIAFALCLGTVGLAITN